MSLSAVVALTWVTWPGAGQLNIKDCSPNGMVANLSAVIHGNRFWSVQLGGIRESRQDVENWDQKQAEAKAMTENVLREAQARLAAIYERYPDLAPTSTEIASSHLRERADEMEEEEARQKISDLMRKQVPILRQCEDAIVAHLHQLQ